MHPNGLLLFGHFSPHVSWYVIAHDSSSNQRKVNLIFCLSDDVIDAALLLLVHVGDVGGASGDVGERVDHESGIWKSMDC